jgi:metallo-beta-lactamase family protein
MHYPRITHHGAADTVTGSCHQLHLSDSASLLIDCGLFQGESASNASPRIDFPLAGIRVSTLGGYSAHADQQGLVDFVKDIPEWPAQIHMVHGEEGAKCALRARLERERPK